LIKYTELSSMMHLPCIDVACVLGWWVLNCGGYRTRWRFVLWCCSVLNHSTTQATSTQGKSIIHYNSTCMFIFYQSTNFYIIL